MQCKKLKEIVVKEFAIHALEALYHFIKTLDKIEKKTEAKHMRFYKVKTKNYHVRLLVDQGEPLTLVRRRGFLKEWDAMDLDSVPLCLKETIFLDSCPPEERNRLVIKMMDLKAFW